MNIPQLTSVALASLVLAAVAPAQSVEAESSSSSKSVIVISKNGKTYKKVIENGKVVAESGDKSLGKDVEIKIGGGDGADIEKVIERIRKRGGKSAKSQSSSKSAKAKRRVVINGETVVDDESGDLDLGGLIERVRRDAKKGGKKGATSRIIINKDGKTIFGDHGDVLDLDLPIEISELFDGKGFDIEKLVEKARQGGGKSRGRVIVKENGATLFDEAFDELGKGGFDFDELDLPMDLGRLFDQKAGKIVIGMPEIEITELEELPGALREMLEEVELDVPAKTKRAKVTPKNLDRRVRVRRDAGEVKTLEAEVKRLQKQVEALQRQLKKAKSGAGELF